jgi:putative holliday junction resolvase
MARILAIDYGLKRTGLAWTDPLQLISTGLDSVDTVVLEEKLKLLFATEKIEKIVVGLPTHFDGSDTDATQPVRLFAERLKVWFPEVSVVFYGERMTSKWAVEAMISAGLKKKKRKDKHLINQVSATIILQEYMNILG